MTTKVPKPPHASNENLPPRARSKKTTGFGPAMVKLGVLCRCDEEGSLHLDRDLLAGEPGVSGGTEQISGHVGLYIDHLLQIYIIHHYSILSFWRDKQVRG